MMKRVLTLSLTLGLSSAVRAMDVDMNLSNQATEKTFESLMAAQNGMHKHDLCMSILRKIVNGVMKSQGQKIDSVTLHQRISGAVGCTCFGGYCQNPGSLFHTLTNDNKRVMDLIKLSKLITLKNKKNIEPTFFSGEQEYDISTSSLGDILELLRNADACSFAQHFGRKYSEDSTFLSTISDEALTGFSIEWASGEFTKMKKVADRADTYECYLQ